MTPDVGESDPTLLERALNRLDDAVFRVGARGFLHLNVLRGFALSELTSGRRVRMPLDRRLWLWRHGFLSETDFLFDPDEETADRYLSDYRRGLARKINGQWRYVMDNKLSFFRVLGGQFDCHATVYGLLDEGRWKPIARSGSSDAVDGSTAGSGDAGLADDAGATDAATSIITSTPDADHGTESVAVDRWESEAADRLFERLSTDGRLVLKPVFGGQGADVRTVGRTADGYRLDDEPIGRDALARFVDGLSGYVVMAFARQADYAAELFPDATNTIRLITMIDEGGEPFVAAAAHRIGTVESAPTDNVSRGGLTTALDLETGELGRAAHWSVARREPLTWHETHPDTGTRITGRTVPGWPAVHERVLELADWFSMAPYVGWDVVVTAPGELAVIEANAAPGSDAVQVHEPMLSDERTRAFFERHGIV